MSNQKSVEERAADNVKAIADALIKKKRGKKLSKSESALIESAAGDSESSISQNMSAATSITGLRRETIQALKDLGSKAFRPGGRIDCKILMADAARNADLVMRTNDLPDIKLEKALMARTIRRECEVRLEQTLKNIAPLDICRRILVRGGKMALAKLMTIPDRTSERFALMTDAAAIREIQIAEIASAVQTLSEESVEKLIKEVLEG